MSRTPLRRTLATLVCSAALIATGGLATAQANPGGGGPNYNGNESIQTSRLTTYDELAAELRKQAQHQSAMDLQVIGQSVQGRDLFAAVYMQNPDNPTIVYLTQQHGNEQLTTEAALEFIKSLGTGKMRSVLSGVNIIVVPMLNPDGAMGDVNFSLENNLASGDRQLTRANANNVDLNRDHVSIIQPETQALHYNVLQKYDVDYLIDFHHQGARSGLDGELVSGSILHPTNPATDPQVLEMSKQLGAIVYNEVSSYGWGLLAKYNGGVDNTIGRNGIATQYDIATLLFEMRGMADHTNPSAILGQKSNGYLIRQGVVTMESTARAIADGSINTVDTSFWDTLPFQTFMGWPAEEGEE